MREPGLLAAAYRRWQGEPLGLATVVRTRGSAYRRPGARMLIRSAEERAGAISGGCLEQDVCARALSGERLPALVEYNTADEADLLFGTSLGCEGVIEVLIERLEPGAASAAELFGFFEAQASSRKCASLATVFEVSGTSAARPGDRLWLGSGGEVGGPLAPGPARETLAAALAAAGGTRVASIELEGGRFSALVERLEPPLRLLVFGAGADAPPLVRLGRELGWSVVVADRRPAQARAERFPEAEEVLAAPVAELAALAAPDARSAAVLMTHNYLDDRELLLALLASEAPYLALLGPKKRSERLLAELAADGFPLTEADRARLHAPAGLDLGAETPEQVALAIVAEIQACFAGRSGGSLRSRAGSIHS